MLKEQSLAKSDIFCREGILNSHSPIPWLGWRIIYQYYTDTTPDLQPRTCHSPPLTTQPLLVTLPIGHLPL